MRRIFAIWIVLCCAVSASAADVRPGWKLEQGWSLQRFVEQNKGEVRKGSIDNWRIEENAIVLDSRSDSVLIAWPFALDPAQYPIVAFEVFVEALPKGADVRKKATDDGAFQIYLGFDRDIGFISPGHTICLLWSVALPKGESTTSAFFSNLKIYSFEQGKERLGQWVPIELDYAQLYRDLFKNQSLPKLKGLSLQADSDNVKSRSVAKVRNLRFLSAPSKPQQK